MITFNYITQTTKSIDLDIAFPFYIVTNHYEEDSGRYTKLYKFQSQKDSTILEVYDDFEYKCIFEIVEFDSYNENLINLFIEQNNIADQNDNKNLYYRHIENLKKLL